MPMVCAFAGMAFVRANQLEGKRAGPDMRRAIEVLEAFENIRRAQRAGVYAPHKPFGPRPWLDKAPALRLYREPKRRIRCFTPEDFHRLLGRAQGTPARSGDLRRGNGPTPSQRDQAGMVAGERRSKDGLDLCGPSQGQRDIHVSLNETSLTVCGGS